MAGILDTLFRGGDTDDVVSVIPGLLRPIDTKALASTLKLESLGRERGKNNLPQPNEVTFDSVEQSVLQSVTAEWTWNCNELGKVFKVYADRLSEYSVKAEAETLRVTAKDAGARFLNATAVADADLGPYAAAFMAAKQELLDFKSKHVLSRPARSGSRRWTTVGLLIFLVAIESIANGLFFAKGSDAGLIGGIGTAIGISAFNVIFAFLVGLVPARYGNRRNVFIRYLSIILTMLEALVILVLHGFAAHLRDVVALVDQNAAMPVALRNLLTEPWLLKDLTSYYLFGLGLLFAVASFWKGYTFDDPYPGFGPVTRRFELARKTYSNAHVDLFEDLEHVKEETVSGLIEGINRIPIYFQRADQIRTNRRSLAEAIRNYEPGVETAGNQLLQIYRDANRSTRKTEPPAHFNVPWRLSQKYVDTVDFARITSEGEVISRAEVNAILAELRPLADELLQQYISLY